MEGYQFTSVQAPGSALAGNSLLVQQPQQQPTNLINQQYYYEYHQQQPQQHQQQNSTDYLFAPQVPSQNSPSFYFTTNSNTQAIYSSPEFSNTNSFTAAVSTNSGSNVVQPQITTTYQPEFHSTTIVPESFDFAGNNFDFLQDSSVFLSPQASSAASSASQSPESQSPAAHSFAFDDAAAAAAAADSLDLSLDELLQNIGNAEEDDLFGGLGSGSVEDLGDLSDELLEVLKDVEGEDFFSELTFSEDLLSSPTSGQNTTNLDINSVCSFSSDLNSSPSSSPSSNSSVSSTPKRKYSSDSSSSTYCYSEASYQTAYTSSSSSSCSSEQEDIKPKTSKAAKPSSNGNKRTRRAPKASPVEKAARKKDQNKRAACRYRSKKRTELQSSEMTMEELEAARDRLAEQVQKLQTEFSVILPLAKAAFSFDATKREHLSALLARVGDLLN